MRRHELQARRREAGKSQEQVAEAMGVSVQAVRNWESGLNTPLPEKRPKLAAVLGIGLDRLAGMLNYGTELNGHVVPATMTHYDSLVMTAGRLDVFDRSVVHGLTQTARYATGVEAASGLGEQQIAARVRERQARQTVLYRTDSSLMLSLLLTETIFHEVVGGPDVMAEQCAHLIEVAGLPNVTIQLLPSDGRSLDIGNGVELITKPNEVAPYMAVTFDPDARLRYFAFEDIPRFTSMLHRLAAKALPPDETIARLDELRSMYSA